jgi:hypothetical protein
MAKNRLPPRPFNGLNSPSTATPTHSVNPPDISTPETENPPEPRAVSRTEWRLGPLGIAAMVVLVLADMAVVFVGPFRSSDALSLGLSFGQMGAVILLAASAREFTWQWIMACYAAAILMCIHFVVVARTQDLNGVPMLLTIWVSYTSLTLAILFGMRWLRQQQSQEELDTDSEKRIQFSVRHLLILTTVLAAASLLLRYAIPDFVGASAANIVGWVLLSVSLIWAAVELRRLSRNLFWQLGGLATVGIVCTVLVTWMVNFEGGYCSPWSCKWLF